MTTPRIAPIDLNTLDALIETARTQQAQLRNDLYEISVRPDAGKYQHSSGLIQGHIDGLTDRIDILVKLAKDANDARDKELADRAAARFEASLIEREERILFDESL